VAYKEFSSMNEFEKFISSYFSCKKCGKTTYAVYKIDDVVYCAKCYKILKGEIE